MSQVAVVLLVDLVIVLVVTDSGPRLQPQQRRAAASLTSGLIHFQNHAEKRQNVPKQKFLWNENGLLPPPSLSRIPTFDCLPLGPKFWMDTWLILLRFIVFWWLYYRHAAIQTTIASDIASGFVKRFLAVSGPQFPWLLLQRKILLSPRLFYALRWLAIGKSRTCITDERGNVLSFRMHPLHRSSTHRIGYSSWVLIRSHCQRRKPGAGLSPAAPSSS